MFGKRSEMRGSEAGKERVDRFRQPHEADD